jgi:hypothetical protein
MNDDLRAQVDAYIKRELGWESFMDEEAHLDLSEVRALLSPLLLKIATLTDPIAQFDSVIAAMDAEDEIKRRHTPLEVDKRVVAPDEYPLTDERFAGVNPETGNVVVTMSGQSCWDSGGWGQEPLVWPDTALGRVIDGGNDRPPPEGLEDFAMTLAGALDAVRDIVGDDTGYLFTIIARSPDGTRTPVMLGNDELDAVAAELERMKVMEGKAERMVARDGYTDTVN